MFMFTKALSITILFEMNIILFLLEKNPASLLPISICFQWRKPVSIFMNSQVFQKLILFFAEFHILDNIKLIL